MKTVAVKCDLCSFQESGPECVRTCPTNALRVMNDDSFGDSNATKRLASATANASLTPVGLDAALRGSPSASSTEERD